jgi:CDP-archaeol synthase
MSFEPYGILYSLILISTANSAPVFAQKIFKKRFAQPVDGGLILADQRRLFGSSKTWRGIIAAIVSTAVIAPMIGIPVLIGAGFGAISIGADLLASFIKRRLGYLSSSRVRLLDVFPEALLPMLVFQSTLGLEKWDTLLILLIFFVFTASVSPLLYSLRIRNRPY